MRIGIVSDIHCNFAGLQAGLDAMGPIDELVCAGDSVMESRWSNEVVGLLYARNAQLVLGNHEDVLLGPLGAGAIDTPTTERDLVGWLRAQPSSLELVRDGKRILITHGSPWSPRYDYLYPHDAKWRQAASLDYDLLVVGHTHFKMAERIGRVLVINPGSAGDPRDHRNGRQLSCCTWDSITNEVTFYDYPDPKRLGGTEPRE